MLGAIAVCALVAGRSALTRLDLSRQIDEFGRGGIGDAGASALGKALSINRTLKVLDLRSNDIGHLGASALAAGLEVNRTLAELNLAGFGCRMKIGDSGAKAVA